MTRSADDDRLEELLAEHLPGLRGFLRRRAPELVLERESPDDLAQSVCRDLLEHAADGRFELRSDPEFKQWLYEASLWKLRQRTRHHRAQRRDVAREVGPWAVSPGSRAAPGATPPEPRTSETPSRIAATEEARTAVRAAIEALGGRDAEVLRLAVLESRSHGEIAESLGISEGNSRVLLSRALAKLSRRIEGID